MDSNERRDDWRNSVDEHLVSLTTAQKVTDTQLEEIELTLDVLDKVIRGDTERETSGLIGRIETMERQIAELRSLVIMDSTGKQGLMHDVQLLLAGERTSEHRWKYFTSVTVAIISLLGLLITNWDRIQAWMHQPITDPVDIAIDRAAHPKPKHRHYTIKETPSDE